MNRRAAMTTLATLPFVTAQFVTAQPAPTQPPFDSFTAAATAIWHWLDSLSGELDTFVAQGNRTNLGTKCHTLNESLHAVETAKRSLLDLIRSSRGTQKEIDNIKAQASAIAPKIVALRASINNVAVLLREQAKQGGDDCETKLTSAVQDRKAWVWTVIDNPQVLSDPTQRAEILAKGTAAVNGLHNASIALANLTNRLENA